MCQLRKHCQEGLLFLPANMQSLVSPDLLFSKQSPKRTHNYEYASLVTKKHLCQGPKSHSFEKESSGRIRHHLPATEKRSLKWVTASQQSQLTPHSHTDQPLILLLFSDSSKFQHSSNLILLFKAPELSLHKSEWSSALFSMVSAYWLKYVFQDPTNM